MSPRKSPASLLIIPEMASLSLKKARNEIRRDVVKGHKEYICDWCGQIIKKAEEHIRTTCSVVSSGRKKAPVRYREHKECWKAVVDTVDSMPTKVLNRFMYPVGQERGRPCSSRKKCVMDYKPEDEAKIK